MPVSLTSSESGDDVPPVIFAGAARRRQRRTVGRRRCRRSYNEQPSSIAEDSAEDPHVCSFANPRRHRRVSQASLTTTRKPRVGSGPLAKLTKQISDLEAALAHASAKEDALSLSLNDMQEQLAQKNRNLEDSHRFASTMEHEYRCLKRHFRDLMESSLPSATEAKDEMPVIPIDGLEGVAIPDPARGGEELLSSPRAADWENRRRRRSSTSSNVRIFETEELISSLRGTNGYAQQLLKRNSILEQRCNELENLRDVQIREMHDALQLCRTEQTAAVAAAERYRVDAAEGRHRIADLHSELQFLHEALGSRDARVSELTKLQETVASKQEALDRALAEAGCASAEWAAEKQHLCRRIEVHEKLLASREAASSFDDVAAEQVRLLEEKLAATQQTAQSTLSKFEQTTESMKVEIRQLSCQIESETQARCDEQFRCRALETSLEAARQQLDSVRSELSACREELATSAQERMEAENLRAEVDLLRERCEARRAQIARHVEAVRISSEKYAELAERNGVLEQLVQRQQLENGDLVTDGVKINSRLHCQADNYRNKYEAAYSELQSLRVQVAEHAELLRKAVEQERVQRDRESLQLREEFGLQRGALARNADKEVGRLRAEHMQEVTTLRKTKDAQLESVVAQYETCLAELKIAHNNQVRELRAARERDVSKMRDEVGKRVGEAVAVWSERLAEEKNQKQKEIEAVTSSYQSNFLNEMKKKAEEIAQLRRELDGKNNEMERLRLLADRQVQDVQLQLERETARLAQEVQNAANAAVAAERGRGEVALIAAQEDHAQAVKTLQDAHNETTQLLKCKLSVVSEKLECAGAEVAQLVATVESREAALAAVRDEAAAAVEMAEAQTRKEQAAALKETQSLSAKLAEATTTIQKLRSSGNVDEIDRLNKKIAELVKENAEWNERVKGEISLLQCQLQRETERANALLSETQFVSSVMKRNVELEEAAARETNDYEVFMKKQADRLADVEKQKVQMEGRISLLVGENEKLKTEIEIKTLSISSLTEKLAQINTGLQRTAVLEERVSALSSETATLRASMPGDDESGNKLKEAQQALLNSNALCHRLEQEMLEMRDAVEGASKKTLELEQATLRLHAQEEFFEIMTASMKKKEELIVDLQHQLSSFDSPQSLSFEMRSEYESRIEKLHKKCQELADLQLAVEQERRSLGHRMELSQQTLARQVVLKEEQLRLLLEANRRSEICFARNVELEERLLRLTAELERLRRESARARDGQEASLVERNAEWSNEVSLREGYLRKELDALSHDLLLKDGEIRLLQARSREMKAKHQQETDELTSRLQLAAMEQSINPTGESKSLQLMIDRISELQEEAKLMREARDAQICRLKAENVALRSKMEGDEEGVPLAGPEAGGSLFLETRIETLQLERDALRCRVAELVEALRSCSLIDVEEVAELRRRNNDLRAQMEELNHVLAQQQKALDAVSRHANEAMQHNGSLQELASSLDLHAYSEHIFENILKRNIELEELLNDLRAQNEKERQVSKLTSVSIVGLAQHQPYKNSSQVSISPATTASTCGAGTESPAPSDAAFSLYAAMQPSASGQRRKRQRTSAHSTRSKTASLPADAKPL